MNLTIGVKDIVSRSFPGLFEKTKNFIEETESFYDENMQDSHLWEHTLHVSSIALRLAEKEKTDPLPVILAALFHDAGKFSKGEYHKDKVPEGVLSEVRYPKNKG